MDTEADVLANKSDVLQVYSGPSSIPAVTWQGQLKDLAPVIVRAGTDGEQLSMGYPFADSMLHVSTAKGT